MQIISGRAGTLSLVLCCVAAIVISLYAITNSQEIESAHRSLIAALERDVKRIEGRLERLTGSGTGLASVGTQQSPGADNGVERMSAGAPRISGTHGSAEELARELGRLRDVIDSTGLGRIAEEGNTDLTFLKEMSERRSRMMGLFADRRALVDRSEELQRSDEEHYGTELRALYEKARLRVGAGGGSVADRETAFNEIVDRYPDSYAAASLIAERALSAAMRRDTDEAERYHDMLLSYEDEDFRNAITAQGAEAMPAIEANLARSYIQEGRTEEGLALLDSLEQNYPDSVIFTGRGGRRGPPFQPVSRVVQQLRAISSRTD